MGLLFLRAAGKVSIICWECLLFVGKFIWSQPLPNTKHCYGKICSNLSVFYYSPVNNSLKLIPSVTIYKFLCVLQTWCSRGSSTNTFVIHQVIQSVILLFRIFKTLSIPNREIWRAKLLKECSPPTMCHMSCVTCEVSGVRCRVSPFFWGGEGEEVVELVDGGFVINGAWPVL